MSSDPARAPRAALTATSFTVLGLLCLQPWSAYELATQMQRGWDEVWPRAVRGIYNEPKKLVKAGFATAYEENTGQRTRTVYEATPQGRSAFQQWLAQPPAPPKLEAEALVRVLFGEQGTTDELLTAIRSLADFAEDHSRDLLQMGLDYLLTGGPFSQRQHVLHLVGGFLAEYHAAILRWAAWAQLEVSTWDSVESARDVPDLDRLGQDVRLAFERNLALVDHPPDPDEVPSP